MKYISIFQLFRLKFAKIKQNYKYKSRINSENRNLSLNIERQKLREN